jgi:predicted DCC family thiol-disulfide oxidoreductase YuxK
MSWVLFFDGDCAFCSAAVRQVVALDRHHRISFAPLQGTLATELELAKYAAKTGGTMILLREPDRRVFMKSDGLIELARALGGWWRLMTLARFIPKWLRDTVYGWIADNRHRFVGKSDVCSLPNPELQKRLRE